MKIHVGLRSFILLVLIGIIVLTYAVGAKHGWSVAQLEAHRIRLMGLVDTHFTIALLVSVSSYIIAVALNIPIADLLTLLCGMLFGRWLGTAAVVLAASIGATLSLLIIRYLAGDLIRSRLFARPRVKRLITGFRRHTNSYLLVMRLIPMFPFWLVNLAMAITDISTGRFFILTFIGIIPGSFIYANVGANLAHVDTAHGLVSTGTLLSLGLLALLVLLPVFVSRVSRLTKTLEEEH